MKIAQIKMRLLSLALLSWSFVLSSADLTLNQQCNELNNWIHTNTDTLSPNDTLYTQLTSSENVILFKSFPNLKIPYLPLAQLPTPITTMTELGKKLGNSQLYMKNDSCTNNLFGGNKVRKLCFVLAQAALHKADVILTVGAGGSNHSAATIAHTQQINIPCESFLSRQQTTVYCQRNLILSKKNGGTVHEFISCSDRKKGLLTRAKELQKQDKKVYYIPSGASNALGSLGYVNAAFELKKQIDNNEIPKPDYIFVAVGSNGTASGLALGLALAGLDTKIIGVMVVPMTEKEAADNCLELVNEMCTILQCTKPSNFLLPLYISNYFGDGYACIQDKTAASILLLQKAENIKIDGTYAGKALSAFVDCAQDPAYKNKVLLLWNTFYTDQMDTSLDIDNAPEGFEAYFDNTALQESDRKLNNRE